jgi:aminoglycoside/choline kinase family phosphotransferase
VIPTTIQPQATEASPRLSSDILPPPPPQAVQDALGLPHLSIEWLAGDGSDRCYYRVTSKGNPSYVLMQLSENDAKNLRIGGYDWVHVAKLLDDRGIFVPKVVTLMPDFAALIIQDYGDVMLESEVTALAAAGKRQEILDIYGQSIEVLASLLKIPFKSEEVWCQRKFDAERYVWEMKFFLANYINLVAPDLMSAKDIDTFLEETDRLAAFLDGFSKWFVHRDFHSRNVMIKDGQLAIIDFQDARIGPAAYDLISLCFDAYVPLTTDARWEIFQLGKRVFAKTLGNKVAEEIEQQWKAVLLQRQIKAIGSFGYLTLNKKRGNYLKYVAPAVSALVDQKVFDARWPFLSSVLPQKIATAIAKHG